MVADNRKQQLRLASKRRRDKNRLQGDKIKRIPQSLVSIFEELIKRPEWVQKVKDYIESLKQ